VKASNLLSILLVTIFVLPYSFGRETEVCLEDMRARGQSSTDCGLYALLAASNSIGDDISYKELFSPARTHQFKDKTGISAKNLTRLANQSGIFAKEMNGLSVQDLAFATTPILILLDSGTGSSKHWIAVLGIDNSCSKALIYDSLDSEQHRSLSEIALNWNGKAVLVGRSDTDINASSIKLQIVSGCRTAMLIAVPILILFAMNVFVLPFAVAQLRIARKTTEMALVVMSIGILAFGICLSQGVAQLRQNLVCRNCWDAVQLPDADVEYIRVLPPPQSCILVDCRLPIDFSYGHIPRAKNVPVSYSLSEWNHMSQTFGKEDYIVLYCQSANCGWAALMQKRLECMGRKAAVLSGGYERYMQDGSNRGPNESL